MNAARPDDTVTWRQLWAETADAVGDRNRSRWLCEVASASVDGDEFLARLDEPATERMVSHLDTMVARTGPASRSSTCWGSGASGTSHSASIVVC